MKIGFVGLGLMGRGMAANLQKAGHELVVHDLSEAAAEPFLEQGAIWAETPKAVAEACDLIFSSLPTPAVVKAVCNGENGLAAGFRRGAVWFDLSTNAVDVVRELCEQLAAQDVRFLDAPVSGGPGGAASGKLAILVGGDRAAFDAFEPILCAMGDQVRYIGPIGAGSIAKLAHNTASSAMVLVVAEVMTMGAKAGLEPLALWEAIRTGVAGRLRSFDNISKRFLPGRLDPPSFALELAYKDVSLGMQLARDFGVPMRLCNLMHQDMMEALNRGWGKRDAHAFLLLQQERAGVPPFEISEEDINAAIART
jgi:3-hydroxyisobutyrate dehydrogenase-like beta-hydroxyacid dehydrogenase